VEHPNHQYDKNYVVFALRHEGVFDFEQSIGDYNVCIGSVEPSGEWPLFPTDIQTITGFAQIVGENVGLDGARLEI